MKLGTYLVLRKQDEMVGHVEHTGDIKNLYTVFFRMPEGKRSLGRPRHSTEDNVKMYFKRNIV
jgi:hypothetical protein